MKLYVSAFALLTATLAACVPRTVPPPPPLPLPAPPPTVTSEDVERARVEQARRSWEEATALGRQGRWSEAEARLRVATRQDPRNPTYQMALGNVLVQQGRDSEAADALLAGIRAGEAVGRPSRRILIADYDRLIELLTRVGRIDEARAARARQAEHRRLRDAEG